MAGYAPAKFNRLVARLFRPHRAYAQTYIDGIFVHSRAAQGRSDVNNHIDHLRAVLECMRTNKLYANASTCIFGADEIPFFGMLHREARYLGGSRKGEGHSGSASSKEP